MSVKLEAGQWYRDKKGNIRRCAYIINHDSYRARFLMEWDDGSAGFVEEHEVGEHLPDCTGFDWEPPKPEPKYRPFANADEFKPYREKWVKYKQSDTKKTMLCVSFSNEGVTASVSFMPYRNAFDSLVFEDGTPFGIRVDE